MNMSLHTLSLTHSSKTIVYFFPSFALAEFFQLFQINKFKMFLPTLFLISCHLTSGSSYTFLSIGDWGANTIPDRGSMSYQKNVGAVASQLTKSYQENDAKFVLNLVRTSSSEIRHTKKLTFKHFTNDREILSIGAEFKTLRTFKFGLISHLTKISRWTGTLSRSFYRI